ncbi:hypothetical protein [Demequina litorisediminis]|uniref:Periplasmic binding protein/LacI sugar binding domain-containing protein n=1 Tax=Demequina litorisediminis TaxID=1849022 RepID=A0ABQ6IID1_9MICO|nr:hypothetical protein [Demequina litorisediminis]GMA37660.1 hypothetical protein GCM10025876_38640 [Demequina litorisediminis]
MGLVITREPAMLGIEPFFMTFVAGIEEVLSDRGYALLLQVTPDPDREAKTYREWWSANRVDGIFLTDLAIDDPRLDILEDIGLPAVVVGEPAYARDFAAVGSDDAGAARAAMRRIAELGHRRVAHVAGPESLRSHPGALRSHARDRRGAWVWTWWPRSTPTTRFRPVSPRVRTSLRGTSRPRRSCSTMT